MKYFFLIILFVPIYCSAQLFTSDFKFTTRDTLEIIKTSKLENENIVITCNDYRLSFDKESILASIDNQIEKWENDITISGYKDYANNIHRYKRVRKYITSKQKHNWSDFCELETSHINEKSDEEITKALFDDIACELIDSGQFALYYQNKPQRNTLKIYASFYDGSGFGNLFVTENGVAFWIGDAEVTID